LTLEYQNRISGYNFILLSLFSFLQIKNCWIKKAHYNTYSAVSSSSMRMARIHTLSSIAIRNVLTANFFIGGKKKLSISVFLRTKEARLNDDRFLGFYIFTVWTLHLSLRIRISNIRCKRCRG